MSQVAEARWLGRGPRLSSQCQPSKGWPQGSANLRSAAEGMLRELAFVYQATRSIRESILESTGGVKPRRMEGLRKVCC